MIKARLALVAVTLFSLSGIAAAGDRADGIEHLDSEQDIQAVDQGLRDALDSKGLTLFTVIDHADNAQKAGLSLPPTRTFVFGNPKVGTPMMVCQGSMALDLPQKMVLRQLDEGTRLEWNSPHYLAERHRLTDCELPLDKVAGILEAVAQEAATP
ncbi:DUF302 domain-containing protein [Halomonas sp. YLGW01]|uniref:DUF302 domain-containing protein n=1 Tax=Halomonas sp. YLGW01 TaxID=2773308 RepID=UPI00177C246F|nr:DUF302 domain-containing protein [Halomonas sp. YLGW01]